MEYSLFIKKNNKNKKKKKNKNKKKKTLAVNYGDGWCWHNIMKK